MVAKSTSR